MAVAWAARALGTTAKVVMPDNADPKRIGLQGHSWGGYQSSFMVTQTDLFACVVTGAPLTNLVSMHNVLYKRRYSSLALENGPADPHKTVVQGGIANDTSGSHQRLVFPGPGFIFLVVGKAILMTTE